LLTLIIYIGGSDIALCCDVLVMQEDAKIGHVFFQQKTFKL
jgi:enoyl-CoA hydratase/carnithine racemase